MPKPKKKRRSNEPRKKRNYPEHAAQAAYFEYVGIRAKTDERYSCIVAIPNQGIRGGAGWGNQRRKEGLSKGFPDIAILVQSRGYGGAFIELKIKPNRPSKEQLEWIRRLEAQGYQARVAWSTEELIEFTKWYFGETDEGGSKKKKKG